MNTGNRRSYSYDKTRTSYIEGSTVRKLDALPERRRIEEPYEIPSRRRQSGRHPKALSGINIASLFVLCIAAAVTLYFCVDYLKLQYSVNHMEKDIIAKEATLNAMKSSNDAAYEAIDISYDLDYVYRVAVEELGMVYPNKNRVITYQSDVEDYVRQYADIPD